MSFWRQDRGQRRGPADPDLAAGRGDPTDLDAEPGDQPAPAPSKRADDTPNTRVGSAARRRFGRRTRRETKKAPWWELPVLLIVAILVAILVKSFLVQPFYIPSASMERTLHGCEGCAGDRIVVNKPVYSVFRDPHPGDIVVFRAPTGWEDEAPTTSPPANPVLRAVRWFGQLVGVVPPDETDLVKRVIATGGQTVKCCDAAGNVQVSDKGPTGPYRSYDDRSFVFEDPGAEQYGALPFGPITVPSGRLWVMGDHRNNSKDSRYYCGGAPSPGAPECVDATTANATTATVPVQDVIGKAVIIAWPPSRWTTLGAPPTFDDRSSQSMPAGLPITSIGGSSLPVVAGLGMAGRLRRRATKR